MTQASRVACPFLVLAAAWAAIPGNSSAQGQGAVTIETIVKAWKEREEQVRSARFVWTETETITRGFLTKLVDSLPMGQQQLKEMGIPPGSVVPPEDSTHDVPSSLCLDGDKISYSRDARQWSAKEQAYVVQPKLAVFDGELGTTLATKGTTYMPWPYAQIRSGPPAVSTLYLGPLMTAFRPFHNRMRIVDIQSMIPTSRRATIMGRPCMELEQRSGSSVQRIWVDPSRNYNLVRYIVMDNERMRSKVDVEYRKGDGGRWLPEKWDIQMLDLSGKLETAARGKLTKHEINVSVDPGEFNIEFPSGTRVHDVRNPKSPVDYIVKEGTKKRMILPEERGVTYDELINSEPGQTGGNRKSSWLTGSVGIALIVLIVAGGMLVWRIRVGHGKKPMIEKH